MIQFINGPAAGRAVSAKAAPALLRVVIGPRGAVDVLDQPEDEPRLSERVVVYRRIGKPNHMHIKASGKGGKALTGWWPSCDYEVLPDADQPTDQIARDNAAWRAWCEENSPRLCPGQKENVMTETAEPIGKSAMKEFADRVIAELTAAGFKAYEKMDIPVVDVPTDPAELQRLQDAQLSIPIDRTIIDGKMVFAPQGALSRMNEMKDRVKMIMGSILGMDIKPQEPRSFTLIALYDKLPEASGKVIERRFEIPKRGSGFTKLSEIEHVSIADAVKALPEGASKSITLPTDDPALFGSWVMDS